MRSYYPYAEFLSILLILTHLIFLLFGYMYFSGEEYFKEKSEEEKIIEIIKALKEMEKEEKGWKK